MRKFVTILEGKDEWHLLRVLPEPIRSGIKEHANSESTANLGVGVVAPRLGAFLNRPEPQVILVICDAEVKLAQSRWMEIKRVLERREFKDTPETLPRGGVILENDNEKRVGIWIMPDNEGPGMLEDFYLSAIPSEDTERKLAQEFVDGIREPKFARKTEQETLKVKRKAVLGVWLAIQKDPVSAGEAVERKWISIDSGSFPPLLKFLRELLGELIPERSPA